MVTPIRIGIVGTHSTGKTSLLRRIEMEIRAQGRSVVRNRSGLAVEADKLGFPKLQQQTAAATEWIITAGIARELEATLRADVVLVDRAAPDPLAYHLAALDHRGEHGVPQELNRLHRLVQLHAASYTLLLATVLDPDVALGEHRDRDPHFRQNVDHHLHQLLAELRIPHQNVRNTAADQDAVIQAALVASSREAAA